MINRIKSKDMMKLVDSHALDMVTANMKGVHINGEEVLSECLCDWYRDSIAPLSRAKLQEIADEYAALKYCYSPDKVFHMTGKPELEQ